MTPEQLDALGQAIDRKTRCTTIYSDIAMAARYECGKLDLGPVTDEEWAAWCEHTLPLRGFTSRTFADWLNARRLAAVTPKPIDPRREALAEAFLGRVETGPIIDELVEAAIKALDAIKPA